MKLLLIISFALLLAACNAESNSISGKYAEDATKGSLLFDKNGTVEILDPAGVATGSLKYIVEGTKIKLVGGGFDLIIIDKNTLASPGGNFIKK